MEEALELLSIDCGLSSDIHFSQKRIAAKRNRSRWSRASARRCDKEVEPVESEDPDDPDDPDDPVPKERRESDRESEVMEEVSA